MANGDRDEGYAADAGWLLLGLTVSGFVALLASSRRPVSNGIFEEGKHRTHLGLA
jgi:hypothetical protein